MVMEPAELGHLVGPEGLHREHLLAHQRPPPREVDAVVLHLLAVPAEADAEDEASLRQPVESRELLGEGDRVVLGRQADAGSEQDAARERRRGGQRDVINPA